MTDRDIRDAPIKWKVQGAGFVMEGGFVALVNRDPDPLVQLADMAPPEAAQEGAQGGGSLSRETEHAGGPAGAQHIGVVDAISAG